MAKYLFIPLVLLVNLCSAQNTKKNEVENPGNIGPKIPFIIENSKEYLEIDSLKGLAVLYLFVTDESKIESFNIVHLSLKKEGNEVINFNKMTFEPLSIESYPDEIKPYYYFLKEYLSTLSLERKTGVKIDSLNKIYLNIK